MRDALVVGAAWGVWDDLRAAAHHLQNPEVFAVGEMVVFYPPLIEHAVSHHAEQLVHWRAARRGDAYCDQEVVTTHSSLARPGIDRAWLDFREGDSALLAVRVALSLGFTRVIVIGVQLQSGVGHVWEDVAGPMPFDFTHYREHWTRLREEFIGRVFGVSGFVGELLGSLA